MIQKTLTNFAVEQVKNDGELFGKRSDNGLYDGAIGNIKHFTIDIALIGFFIRDYGTNKVEFSVSVYEDQFCLMT